MERSQLLETGRHAVEGRDWRLAFDRLEAADELGPLGPEDLERLATAAYLTGRDEGSVEAWTRAHQAWQHDHDPARAVRCAFWLGLGLVQRGQMAQGGGWLARAGRLVEEHAVDTVERGYLLLPQGLAAMGERRFDAALAVFDAARQLATRFGDPDLGALGAIGRGEALLRLGRTAEGMEHFDEAMVSVTAGETSPVVAGIVYCAVIDACQKVFDLHRACEWTMALDRWCARQAGLVPFRGQCLVHRAQVMQVRGEWQAAADEAEAACRRLSDPPHPAAGMAWYQVAELHRLRGELPQAARAYRQAHAGGHDPQPGLALLTLAEGRTGDAASMVAVALDERHDRMARCRLLPAVAEIMVAAGRTGEARAVAGELDELAAGAGSSVLASVAAETGGAVLIAEGRAAEAVGPLRSALQAWQELAAPYQAARVRVLLAAACLAVGEAEGARLEREAARAVFERLGAGPDLARLDRLAGTGGAGGPVTRRELEVLRLVAAGHPNRRIAAELVISEKTVERHLSNIFTKLDVANRAAATAYAYDHGLL
ncbi:MAG TPA: LuxR C-terminal-related transcriptional regulator [Acidimicrobiales bacterium]|nr:LuxR C-terminal-related transcriptional regulator [Acidimicrobiales bacterium]